VRLLAACLCALACAAATGASSGRDLSAYGHLGTWIDIWDTPYWQSPETAVAAMRAEGVSTLYIETSNYSQTQPLVRPAALGRFVDAAHAAGLKIVAWYLPSLAHPAVDLRRSLAAIRFRSPAGGRFDSFALDIEASVVKPALRTVRVVALARQLRAAVGSGYTLGAIMPAPRGMDLKPKYWPGFPYAQLPQYFDVFLPMGYFTYRYRTAAAALAYTTANVEELRERSGVPDLPVHAVGGIASSATVPQVRAFVQAALGAGALGASLYDDATTSAAKWRALQPLAKS
jgi:hypothetical protein